MADSRPETRSETADARMVIPTGIYQPASYHHAMWAGETLYVAGQVARDAAGKLIAPGDAAAQAVAVFANLAAVLDAAGVRRDEVVKVTTYLVDGADGQLVGAERMRFFGDHRPPHTGLVVAALGSPEVRVEVEVIAQRRR
jgi:2-iminobutanoate/2-iminopropanoate deaminase